MFLVKDIINELNKVTNNRPDEYLISNVEKVKLDDGRYAIEVQVINFDKSDNKKLVIKIKE